MASLSRVVDALQPIPPWVRIGLLAGLCFFLGLGGAPLFDVDEGAFTAATMEMLVRQDYITTYLGGQPRFDKPILIYWLQAASVSVFGLHEWALRLPSALAATGWLVVTWRFARRLGEDTGLYAALILGCALGPFLIGRAATTDALLNVLVAAALLDAWRHLEGGGRAPLLRAYAWIGLGLLAKGPVALLVPLMATASWCALSRCWRLLAGVVVQPLGWLILLAIAGPWYVLEYLDQGQAFIDGFILKHNVNRFTATMLGHGGSPLYYVVLLPLLLLPFTGLLAVLAAGWREQWRDPLDRYLWLAFACVLVFFSFSRTQLPHYALYGFTPLAILLARHRARLRHDALAYVPPLLLGALLLLAPEAVGYAAGRAGDGLYRELLRDTGSLFTPGFRLAALALCALPALLWGMRVARPHGLAVVALAQVALFALVFVPLAGWWQQGPVVRAAQHVRGSTATVVAWGANHPSFGVYRGVVTPVRRPVAGEVVLTRRSRLAELPPVEVIFAEAGIVLARVGEAGDGR